MTVNGVPLGSGQATSVTLNDPGINPTTTITIVVTAPDKTEKNYIVFVSRGKSGNNNLRSLTLAPGTLAEPFSSCTVNCTLNVPGALPSNVTTVTVTPELQDPSTATMTVNGNPTANKQARSAPLPAPGSSNSIRIVVTAQNGTQKTYTVNVVRDALDGNNNLKGLTLAPGTLAEPFSSCTVNCTLNVPGALPSSVTNITVTPELQNPATATMKVNGQVTANKQARSAPLPAPGSTNSISIEVTAQNGNKQLYKVNVVRDALGSNTNLSALSVTAGTTVTPFSSPFDSNTVTVAPEITEVLVRADKEDANATMAIGSVTISPGKKSGQATFPLNGAGGEPTPISISVTAQDGSAPKIYSISVIRPAAPTPPLAPTVAPDLIPEDDSCFPQLPPNQDQCFVPTVPGVTNSHDDNLTTIRRPRFTILSPTTGTPSLYVDTTKYPFPAGATTLQPSEDLSQGSHTITYTLTNAVGESDPSPPLAVTIDTTAPEQ